MATDELARADDELAELLLPETVRHHIGLVHPELCAKLVVEAYRIGYRTGREGREQAIKDLTSKEGKRKQANKQ